MWKAKWSRFVDCLCRKPGLILILLPCLLVLSYYVVSDDDCEFRIEYPPYKSYNIVEGTVDGYLVWNPKCHMLAKEPFDASIGKFVKKEKYEKCTNEPLLTRVIKEPNNSMILVLDSSALSRHPDLECCWSPVIRPKITKPRKDNFDSSITVKRCENFENETILPSNIEVIVVTCRAPSKNEKPGKILYENVHAVLNPEKVKHRFEYNTTGLSPLSRKLSVLVLGIDSVSRLNFLRTMPNTETYLRETGWIGLKGYNKVADNTFPNLMAILTGQNQQRAVSRCKPTIAYKLDRCPFIWQNFRNAGYVTAYGEDETMLNTFNYLKVGFVEPPTDYYLRPYILASEKLLTVKKRFGLKYCTGPEISLERIFNYATNFAKTFLGVPYFGFFWTTSVSHDNMNGISSMDTRILEKLKYLEQGGVLNDTMVIFLSDHGMRWGSIRNTFVGWYEERLPFVYIWLPEWLRKEYPEAYESLLVNENRLTSPLDMYETLREVLKLADGDAEPSPDCPMCRSLFGKVPRERGCQDAGVAAHWCTCTAFKQVDASARIVTEGAQKFFEHIESIVKTYKDKKGRRLCAKLALKKLHRVHRVIDFDNSSNAAYFYLIQATPGGGKFEVTIRYYGNGNYTLSDNEVSRINPYATSAKCLDHGMKQYCHCLR